MANVDVQTNDGWTSLHIALDNNHYDVVKVNSFLYINEPRIV